MISRTNFYNWAKSCNWRSLLGLDIRKSNKIGDSANGASRDNGEEMNRKQDFKLQRGASLVEYALLIALVAIAALVAMQVLGQKVSQRFSVIASTIG